MSIIIFNGNETKFSPEAFTGVKLQSYMHPSPGFHDGYDIKDYGIPKIRFSFGMFTMLPNTKWPLTKFSIEEVNYVISGTAILKSEDGNIHILKLGDVFYVPSGEAREIENTSAYEEFKFLSIVDPAWQPEFEKVL
jgi:mannose-6-phosphate isomerase-like protein (cupin superfamily)